MIYDHAQSEKLANTIIVNENSLEINNIMEWQQIMNRSLLLYTPEHETTATIMHNVSKSLGLTENPMGYKNEDQMLNIFNRNTTLAVVIFHEFSSDFLSLTLRFPSQFRTLQSGHNCSNSDCFWSMRNVDSEIENLNIYLKEGFLQLQHSIFEAWAKFYNKGLEEKLPSLSFKAFQHSAGGGQTQYDGQKNATHFIWTFYYFIYLVPFLNLVRKVSNEVENHIPSHCSVYGISYIDYWNGHFIAAFLHLMIINLLILGFLLIEWSLSGHNIQRHLGYQLLFLILYSSMLILNAFILTILFGPNRRSALFMAASLWIASYAIFSIKLGNSDVIDFQTIFYMLIFFNNFFPFGMEYLETNSDDIVLYKIWLLFFIQICAIVFYCCVLYFLKPSSEIHSKESKFPEISTKKEEEFMNENISLFYNYAHKDTNWKSFEYGPVEGHLLLLQNVSTFQDKYDSKPGLKNISMRIFKNEISVIVGPQGSGKTTFISLLSGSLKYKGNIYFNQNKELSKNWSTYCSNMDVIMGPHNHLYEHLTVAEQLKYILILKQKYPEDQLDAIQRELNKWLLLLKSSINDSNQHIRNLNYNQKHLVTLCCVLSGNTQIILLDDPTRYMELEERHSYWNILRQERRNRCIIMTTSSIDESNEIADRIGILNAGKLVAWGSPFFLQNNLGKGFNLVLLLKPDVSVKPITKLLETYIPNITVHAQFKDRIVYILPRQKIRLYQKLLMELERESSNFGISSMYVTGYDLNDIYMELTGLIQSKVNKNSYKTLSLPSKFPIQPHSKISLMKTLFYKKLLYQASNIVPVFVIFLTLLLIAGIPKMFANFKSLHRIEMGLSTNLDSQKNWKNCKYFEIVEIENRNTLKSNWKPQKWFVKNLKCGESEYRKDISANGQFGAVEKDDANHLTLWLNEEVFHGPALVLNLAHNVILSIKQLKSMCYPHDDDRVIEEKVRISNMNLEECKQHTLLIDQLEYEIPKEGDNVNVISLALKSHDCVGIFGCSKSGKSHLIRQLIGEEGFSFGEVYICGNEIKNATQKALTNIGYIPQSETPFEGATPQQILKLFFMLRAAEVPKSKFNETIRSLTRVFRLRNYMNIRISELPKHIRRRLSFAIALILHNQLLIFDEPTKGLDASERHLLWYIMKKLRENGNTILFTSQESMELEQLADYIIVLHNGEMLAMGSPQDLRQKYNRGFYMEIKLKMDGMTLDEIEKK
ncbi:ABC-type organic anion transporter ABCA8-like [Musca vetustissima]|uniref:ABC-type organic anion transporter ABCA8-like n=1 Tax=Musca vetustissima TaxID=27455 RepID=UPI002AB79C72|nr:ABC-type organic anion transporter ABCA8-like [Musca vetustissima]